MSQIIRKGWRNNYRAGMPLAEQIGKDIQFAACDFVRYLRNGMKLPVIVAYPHFPSKKTTLFKIAEKLNYRITNKLLENPRLVISFEDRTLGSSEAIRVKYTKNRIINVDCIDISKEHTDRIHQKVFGYSVNIDPLTYQGKAVQKSSENAVHDGRIVECPISRAEPHSVYQIVIDNSHDERSVVDFRVPVIGSTLPLAYKKFKPNNLRFTNRVERSSLHKVDELLSGEEQAQLVSFAHSMGAQFCELDVLRNRTDGKIYVVDLNKTPYGPPAKLSDAEYYDALELLTSAFRKEFLN